MCGESQRDDALHVITLVEQFAKLAAQGLFGFVFASLAEERKAYATFFCNAVSTTAWRSYPHNTLDGLVLTLCLRLLR